jgi:hypothetical protein
MRESEIEQQAPVELNLPDSSLPASTLPPWYEPDGQVVQQPWLTSSTDLLIAWHPEPVVPGAPQATDWDRYFHPAAMAVEMTRDEPNSTETWNQDAASVAVDCLYRLVRLLEALDVDAAIGCISRGYHGIENDREIDRDGLRLKLDGMVDSWRCERPRLSLTEIPDPVFSPAGILVHATLQADHVDLATGELKTTLLPYIFWFTEDRLGEWLIRSMLPAAMPARRLG